MSAGERVLHAQMSIAGKGTVAASRAVIISTLQPQRTKHAVELLDPASHKMCLPTTTAGNTGAHFVGGVGMESLFNRDGPPVPACPGAGSSPEPRNPTPRRLVGLGVLRPPGGLHFPRPLGALFLGHRSGRRTLQWGIRPFLAGLPEGFHLASELLPGLHLATHQFGLCVRDKTGPRPTSYPAGKTEVGAVTCLGVVGTRTAGLAARNVAFRQRASAHRLGLGELCGQIPNTYRDL
jgi:hypothetical protein